MQSSIEINRKRTTHDTLSITVHGESHVLGNVLKQHIAKDERDSYAGYRKHHPLINEIEIKVQIDPSFNTNEMTSTVISHPVIPVMKETVVSIVKDINTLLDQIN